MTQKGTTMTQIARLRRGPALLASGVMLAAAMVLAGCGSSPGHAGGAATAQRGSATPDDQTMAIVTCYRAHGDPSFPDPVYDPNDGRWHLAVSPGSAPASTQHACQHLFPSGNASPPVPQARFQQLVRLAQCLRQHGVPNWPDPDPDGSFPLPPSLLTKSPSWVQATQACSRLMPSGGLDVHAAA
jgi:hypothetical protein